MIATVIHSIRVSLMSHHRVILLKDSEEDRYLPIWIGPFEADSIAMALQHIQPPRPMTHDLLKKAIEELGATVSHILVSDLEDNTFFARIVLDVNGRHMEVDSRPSDAMALGVRCGVPIYVADEVMSQASIVISPELAPISPEEAENLSAFRDFLNSLDMGEQGDE